MSMDSTRFRARFVMVVGVACCLLSVPVIVSAQQEAHAAVQRPVIARATTTAPADQIAQAKDGQAGKDEKARDKAGKDEPQIKVGQAPAQAPKPAPAKLSRWFDVQAGSLATRYRFIETDKGIWSSNQMQYQGKLQARFKFDPKGRFTFTGMINTGNNFTGSWNNAGPGTGDLVRTWYFKQWYFAGVPAKGVDVSWGGIGVARGEATEITTYDNDAYLTGERVTVKRPKDIFFDDVTFTAAYFGDLKAPGIQDRYKRLGEAPNYYQYMVAKKISKQVAASVDYTREVGVPSFRYAVSVKTPKAGIMDTFRYEQYVRYGSKSGQGFGVYGDKSVTKRVNVGFGFASIDRNYPTVNADRFARGKRVYEAATIKLTKELQGQFFATQAFGNDFVIANKYRVDAILNWNVLTTVQRGGWLK